MTSPTGSAKWYRSVAVSILAAILIPPIGLALLWLRRATETGKKVFGSLCIVLWGAVYVYLVFGGGLLTVAPNSDAHYDQLERHREAQRKAEANSASMPNSSTQPSVSAETSNADAGGAAQPVDSKKETAADLLTRGAYWTSYRGPARDGRYDEYRVRTSWPAEGLPRLWKQPIGGGYASFVVAGGTAYTIEQRRNQEVTA